MLVMERGSVSGQYMMKINDDDDVVSSIQSDLDSVGAYGGGVRVYGRLFDPFS